MKTFQVVEGLIRLGIGLEDSPVGLDRRPWIPELPVLGLGDASQKRPAKRGLLCSDSSLLADFDVALPAVEGLRQSVDLRARGLVGRLGNQSLAPGVERLRGIAAWPLMQPPDLPPGFSLLEGIVYLPGLRLEDADQRLPVAALPMDWLENLNGSWPMLLVLDEARNRCECRGVVGSVGQDILEDVERPRRVVELGLRQRTQTLPKR